MSIKPTLTACVYVYIQKENSSLRENNQGDLHFQIGFKGYNAIIKENEFIINEFMPLKSMRSNIFYNLAENIECFAKNIGANNKCNKLRAKILGG